MARRLEEGSVYAVGGRPRRVVAMRKFYRLPLDLGGASELVSTVTYSDGEHTRTILRASFLKWLGDSFVRLRA